MSALKNKGVFSRKIFLKVDTLYTFASDAKLSVIFATHYATETFGVKNLGNLLSQNFNINFTFIDLEPIF